MKIVCCEGVTIDQETSSPGTYAYDRSGASLSHRGKYDAIYIGAVLSAHYGFDLDDVTVAIARTNRSTMTALYAGLRIRLRGYNRLAPVKHGLRQGQYAGMLTAQMLPDIAVADANKLLEVPPKEEIWFTSELLIAGLTKATGLADRYSFLPVPGEIRELPID